MLSENLYHVMGRSCHMIWEILYHMIWESLSHAVRKSVSHDLGKSVLHAVKKSVPHAVRKSVSHAVIKSVSHVVRKSVSHCGRKFVSYAARTSASHDVACIPWCVWNLFTWYDKIYITCGYLRIGQHMLNKFSEFIFPKLILHIICFVKENILRNKMLAY